ncbi:MAG: PH domain-containing protein [Candidatus Eisenbacteria bacterium]|nr:PH domain-containing protein [Candidatus Eisenbacteria bacterium]
MQVQTLVPSGRYLAKSLVALVLVGLLVLAAGALLAFFIGLEEGPRAARTTMLVVYLVDLAWFVLAAVLTIPYVRSLRYEIRDDEVIVHVGIWTRSIKHVPYRTVTNIKTNRDIFDRWFFDLGSLNIQTAGMSGTSGAEESLRGLPNVHEVYEIVAARLREFRGAMAPTAGGENAAAADEPWTALLEEVRAIRRAVEK